MQGGVITDGAVCIYRYTPYRGGVCGLAAARRRGCTSLVR